MDLPGMIMLIVSNASISPDTHLGRKTRGVPLLWEEIFKAKCIIYTNNNLNNIDLPKANQAK
ncbi:MAG: hypothetical protein KQI62_05800 [Deltaproteobacteria bacterium]|nr:hypothetical protein [Deltaproteobacteria bacterium]